MIPVDITHQIEDPEEMPLCPICDGVIIMGETGTLVKAHGVVGLAHAMCIEVNEDEEI